MSEATTFREMIDRVRHGDQRAAEELVRRYEPEIRRTIRARLRGALRRLLDSADICQSVLVSFFLRARLGRYDLGTPEDLLQLLLNMAHHKLTDQSRQHGAQRRNLARNEAGDPEERGLEARGASPSQQVADRELLEEVRGRLSEQEWQLLELRNQGLSWDEVAAAVGGTAEAARKRLERAGARVAGELGLGDDLLT
jgi:RNA polymerase sigma-70 factor (ECF subfamily)